MSNDKSDFGSSTANASAAAAAIGGLVGLAEQSAAAYDSASSNSQMINASTTNAGNNSGGRKRSLAPAPMYPAMGPKLPLINGEHDGDDGVDRNNGGSNVLDDDLHRPSRKQMRSNNHSQHQQHQLVFGLDHGVDLALTADEGEEDDDLAGFRHAHAHLTQQQQQQMSHHHHLHNGEDDEEEEDEEEDEDDFDEEDDVKPRGGRGVGRRGPGGSFPSSSALASASNTTGSGAGPSRAGRRKIKIEFIDDKSRRHITFSKRKAGIMKKAYELSTLTGTQVLLLVASETGHVYTFATPKLQPLITKPEGKNLIQACLNAPDPNELLAMQAAAAAAASQPAAGTGSPANGGPGGAGGRVPQSGDYPPAHGHHLAHSVAAGHHGYIDPYHPVGGSVVQPPPYYPPSSANVDHLAHHSHGHHHHHHHHEHDDGRQQ